MATEDSNEAIKELKHEIERLHAVNEIQNVMGKHEYYHAVGPYDQEWEELWSHKAPDVAFEHMFGRIEGQEKLKKFLIEGYPKSVAGHYEEMIKMYPEIKNLDKEENYYIGSTVMHTLTTPVIEVAGDGQTAMGVWVSPGHLTIAQEGKLRAFWFWEKYAVDFLKEDGKWRLWHIRVYTDFMSPYEKSWADHAIEQMEKPPQESAGLIVEPKPRANPYKSYGPLTVPRLDPVPPKPYETYDEAFSSAKAE